MNLVAVECSCGHIEEEHLPRFPRPHMLVFCVRCKRVARMVWEPERSGMDQREGEGGNEMKSKLEIEQELEVVKREIDEYPVPTIDDSDSKKEKYGLQIAAFQGMEYALEWVLENGDIK